MSLFLFFQRWRVRRTREAETNRMRHRDEGRGGASWYPPSLRGTSSARYHCPRHNASPLCLAIPHSIHPYSNSLYLSIFLRLDAIELLRKYISSDSRNGGKRGDTAPSSCSPPPSFPPFSKGNPLDAIFTCGGGEEITVKAREFAFVEISRIPADTTPLFPRPYLPFLSPSALSSGFQTQFVYLRSRIFPRDL